MEQQNNKLMAQMHFISQASNYFMYQHQQGFNGQKRVLAVLKLEDGLTQNYLADILALSAGSLTELLKKLEDKGYIYREIDEQDRRSKKIYLTEAGCQAAEEQETAMKQNSDADFFAGLSDAEQEQLSLLLEKIPTGWNADFKAKTDKFIEPFARIKMMKKYRTEFKQKNFSEDEIRNWCHKMRDYHKMRRHCRGDFNCGRFGHENN